MSTDVRVIDGGGEHLVVELVVQHREAAGPVGGWLRGVDAARIRGEEGFWWRGGFCGCSGCC